MACDEERCFFSYLPNLLKSQHQCSRGSRYGLDKCSGSGGVLSLLRIAAAPYNAGPYVVTANGN